MLLKPVVIFSSSSSILQALVLLLQKWAIAHYGVYAADKIKGLWGSNQGNDWNKKFLDNPSEPSVLVDVVMMTHCVNAGFSIEQHYTTRFSFFPLSFLEYRKEHQLQRRLRYRTDLDRVAYAYIQEGNVARTRQGDFKTLMSRNQIINQYYWPAAQEQTFAESAAELEQSHCFHVENWTKAATDLGFELKMLEEDDTQKKISSSLYDEFLECGDIFQCGLYKSLFRRFSDTQEHLDHQDAIVEINRVWHWDSMQSVEMLVTVVNGDEFYGSVDLNTDFILALCNSKEDSPPKAMVKHIKRLMHPCRRLCVLLDYLLEQIPNPIDRDCLNYWDAQKSKAKTRKASHNAGVLLAPIIWSFLTENVPGLDLETILNMDSEGGSSKLTVFLKLDYLLGRYNALDPNSNLWSAAYGNETWNLGGLRNRGRNKITTSSFLKALLNHVGITAKITQDNPSKRKRDGALAAFDPVKWTIEVYTSLKNFCLLTCIFSHNHWINFNLVSPGIERAVLANTLLGFKQEVIEEHLPENPTMSPGNSDQIDSSQMTLSDQ